MTRLQVASLQVCSVESIFRMPFYYTIVQIVDGTPHVVAMHNKLYQTLEEANNEYINLCTTWYKDNAPLDEYVSFPRLVRLETVVLSPDKNGLDVDEIKRAKQALNAKTLEIKARADDRIKQAEDDFIDVIVKRLGRS